MHCRFKGFISLRYLIALLVAMSVLPIVVYIMIKTSQLNFNFSIVSDELCLFQLRRILLISYDIYNEGDCLSFLYKNKECMLELTNKRLVLSPGYQMFLDEVDDLYFSQEGDVLCLFYEKNGKYYQAPLYKTKGIYINEFSDDTNDNNLITFSDV